MLLIVSLAALAMVGGPWLLSMLSRNGAIEETPSPPTRSIVEPTRTPRATPTRPAVRPTATPALVRYSEHWQPTPPPPSPTPTLAPASTPRPRPTPTSTPRISECVRIRWSGGQSGVNLAQILITVEAENRCGRELTTDEVWIWAAGYRDGAIVHSTRGHFFRPLGTSFPEETTIVLPGSASWYDEVVVRVYGPDEIR